MTTETLNPEPPAIAVTATTAEPVPAPSNTGQPLRSAKPSAPARWHYRYA